ncbi:uncharacterized protein LOC103509430 [Diaphorina citri]|uniref:Uncharacterized protein LOC103509430 n=1 Tax=Diaphorina citri TaxID=121845 RepID=A0A1S3D1E4_DIACI|nr:uncharacterized protein LOC103509430 [Diaphorina citri]
MDANGSLSGGVGGGPFRNGMGGPTAGMGKKMRKRKELDALNCPLSLPASSDLYRRYLQELLIMLAPMTPHMASFLWDCCEFESTGLWDSGWPQVDHSWPLAFRCMIHKKLILDLQVVKSDLIKLDKTAALSLLVEQIRTNSKMKSFQYLLEDSGLNASNQQIQLKEIQTPDYHFHQHDLPQVTWRFTFTRK